MRLFSLFFSLDVSVLAAIGNGSIQALRAIMINIAALQMTIALFAIKGCAAMKQPVIIHHQ